MNNKSSYIFSADVVRVVAIICVVIIHTVNIVHARIDFLGGISWWISNILESAARIAIPLFVMLSGYFILGKKETFPQMLTRTKNRLLIPLVAWTIFYLVWNAGKPSLTGLLTFFPRLFSGGALHLYFLFILAGLYCFAPFLTSYLSTHKDSSKSLLWFFLSTGLLFTLGQYILNQCISNSFILWIPYIGYFFGGYVLGNSKPNASHKKLAGAALGLAFVWTAAFNFIHMYLVREGSAGFQVKGCIDPYFNNYVSFNVLIMSFAAFFLLFHFDYKFIGSEKVRKFIHSLASASFGIYLIHLFVVEVIERTLNLRIDSLKIGLVEYMVLKWFVVFGISYGLTLLGLRTPIIKKAFGVKEK